jgi:four helix bundle protein
MGTKNMKTMKQQDIIYQRADKLVVSVYLLSKKIPREELFGYTSQLRRAALSIVLNIVEGFARQQRQYHRRFLEISFGSTKETMYLLEFGVKIGYLDANEIENLLKEYDDVSRMLWVKIQTLRKK